MGGNRDEKRRRSIDFSIKAAWLAISKMYNGLGDRSDISHSTGFVLLNIDRETGTPATKIAPLMGMEARSLTRMLKVMEEKGWIERTVDAEDKRKVIITLTEEGQNRRELARLSVKYFQTKVEEQIGQEKLDVFFEVMEKINRVVDDINRKPLTLEQMRDKVYGNNR